MPTAERVLVIPAAVLHAAGVFTGFRPADPAFRGRILAPPNFQFRPRSEVETDPAFVQLIPYAVLIHAGRVFHYRRGASGTETRLTAKRSVGVGGHVSAVDAAAADPYRAGLFRELAEEVEVRGAFTEALAGFIFDPRTPVGEVHLGVVHVFELDSPGVTPREAGLVESGFAAIPELLAGVEEFETWSAFVLEHLAATSSW